MPSNSNTTLSTPLFSVAEKYRSRTSLFCTRFTGTEKTVQEVIRNAKCVSVFLYPFLQGERCLQGPIWSSKGKAVPAKRGQASHLETISRTTAWKRKNRKMEEAAERRQLASTDGCLLLSNYTDEGSFSHLGLHLSADEEVQGGFTLLIEK